MKRLKVLVGCEFSGVVRDAFLRLGHDAMSCDLLPTEKDGPHYQGNVLDLLEDYWDIGIFHPTCKYVANSGAKHLYIGQKKENGIEQERWDEMVKAARFFKKLYDSKIKCVALENPIMLGYAMDIIGVHWTQKIQPWQFGHPESKATCLWLRNLPPLKETKNVYQEMMRLPKKERERIHYMSPSKQRGHERSRTFPGIADAMAIQWSEYLTK